MMGYIVFLQGIGIDWNELYIIKKSLVADGKVKESAGDIEDEPYDEEAHLVQLIKYFIKRHNHIPTIVSYLKSQNVNVQKYSDLNKLLNENKPVYLKYILNLLKYAIDNDDDSDLYDLKCLIEKMNNIGIDWNELEIIKNSIAADKK